ncbi:MAG: hypothetical protein QOG15_1544 [Solirubrobacteraceae bacterium]|nr:hypothetical protein [Solirubrobacteraceae bacterium]
METAETIAELYRAGTAGDDPDPAYVEQLLAALTPGEAVLFACGWPDNGEKWGPIAQLTVTSRRILDQRTHGAGVSAAIREIALTDVLDVVERGRGGDVLFTTRALVVDLCDGRSLEWEWLTNHQVQPAAAAIRSARDGLTGSV